MQLYDAIRELADTCGRTIASIDQQVFNANKITSSKSRGSVLRADTLARIANSCGYELAMVPSDSMPEDAIVIEAIQG